VPKADGAFELDGRMIDAPIVRRAEDILHGTAAEAVRGKQIASATAGTRVAGNTNPERGAFEGVEGERQ
jgi:hypothetical protein